ncbi:MAG: ureidoglycolate lyase [Rhodospirillales bacterium]|nr:ureidoglycolate lyase [Rhodospirillales bacterium]
MEASDALDLGAQGCALLACQFDQVVAFPEAVFLGVVALPGDTLDPATMRAFISDGTQGVNYHRRVWHHPLVALAEEADFLVIDRGAEGVDCVEHHFAEDERKTVTV